VGSVLVDLPEGGRVAIIRLRSLGDCVLTTPALDILKRFRRDLRVAVVVEDRFRAIFENNPDVDEILPPRIAALRRFRPQLCVNFHGGSRSAWITTVSGAGWRAGFGHYRNQFAYNVRIPRAQEILGIERRVHTAEHLASAMFYLGAPIAEVPRAKLKGCGASPSGLPPGFCPAPHVLHPFATNPAKAWPRERFLKLARRLATSGAEVVVIGGAADDFAPFYEFRTLQGAPLLAIKSVLASASLFVGNDSGPAHMAAAFGVPTVVLFGVSDPQIWGPWRAPSEVLTAREGIDTIRTEQVLEAVARLGVAV
jgi:heptosyltransferase III